MTNEAFETASDISDFVEEFYELLYAAQIEALNEREQEIFSLRFGLNKENKVHTLQEVGNIIGLTRERVRQIINKCISKIKWKSRNAVRKRFFGNPLAQLLNFMEECIIPYMKKNDKKEDIEIEGLVLAFFLSVPREISWLIFNLLFCKENAEDYIKSVSFFIKRERKVQKEERKREWKQKIADEKASRIIKNVVFPSTPRLVSDEMINQLAPERKVNPMNNSGTFFSKINGRYVQYESLLELRYLQILEKSSDVLYYVEQPFRIVLSEGVYYPDFFVVLKDRHAFITEIKPLLDMALYSNIIKSRALWKYCQNMGYGFLITDCYRDFIKLKERKIAKETTDAVLQAVSKYPLEWTEYKKIKNQHKINGMDFVALVIQQKLIYSRSPFLLQCKLKR